VRCLVVNLRICIRMVKFLVVRRARRDTPGYRPTYGAATFTAGSTNAVFRLDRASDTTIHFNSCSFSNGINRLLYEGDTQNQHFHGYIAELIYYSGTISGTDLSLPRASQGTLEG